MWTTLEQKPMSSAWAIDIVPWCWVRYHCHLQGKLEAQTGWSQAWAPQDLIAGWASAQITRLLSSAGQQFVTRHCLCCHLWTDEINGNYHPGLQHGLRAVFCAEPSQVLSAGLCCLWWLGVRVDCQRDLSENLAKALLGRGGAGAG